MSYTKKRPAEYYTCAPQDFDELQKRSNASYTESSGSQRLTKRVTTMLGSLEAKLAALGATRAPKELDLNQDGFISTSELMSAMAKCVCVCMCVCVVFAACSCASIMLSVSPHPPCTE